MCMCVLVSLDTDNIYTFNPTSNGEGEGGGNLSYKPSFFIKSSVIHAQMRLFVSIKLI